MAGSTSASHHFTRATAWPTALVVLALSEGIALVDVIVVLGRYLANPTAATNRRNYMIAACPTADAYGDEYELMLRGAGV